MIAGKVTNMVAWRWMLVPIFLVDVLALTFSVLEFIKQKRTIALGQNFEAVPGAGAGVKSVA